jgi:hypothetical protein
MAPPRGNQRDQQGSACGRGGGGLSQNRGQPQNTPVIPGDVKTIGMERPVFGAAGKPIAVTTNHFPCVIPHAIIHHYDGNDLRIFSFT